VLAGAALIFRYADPEDAATITIRLDDDVHEWLRLTPTGGTSTIPLDVILEAGVAAPPASADDSSVVHDRVTCDECGICPITGVRYKCLVRDDFDLCSACETANPQPFAMMMTKPEVVQVMLTGLQNILKKLPPDALQEALQVIQQCESDKVIKASRS
jgi:hypothetical protein